MFVKIWNVLWPLIIYLAAQNVIAALSVVFFQKIYAVWSLLLAALLCIPIYYQMYQKDLKEAGEEKKNIPFTTKDMVAVICAGAALALFMNDLLMLTPLPQWFSGYEETNDILASEGMLLQILSAGIFACIVEEVSMRGIVYLRMKRYWGKQRAMVFSAMVFGLYHMNVVQAVYAFVLGLFFVWVYERYDHLWASCIAHMSANLLVLLLSESHIFQEIMGTMVGFCLVTCISLMVFWYAWRWLKQTDPHVELKFVEKEPDTLEKLIKEYKEHEKKED